MLIGSRKHCHFSSIWQQIFDYLDTSVRDWGFLYLNIPIIYIYIYISVRFPHYIMPYSTPLSRLRSISMHENKIVLGTLIKTKSSWCFDETRIWRLNIIIIFNHEDRQNIQVHYINECINLNIIMNLSIIEKK